MPDRNTDWVAPIAAHAIGDFLLQPRWMGETKLDAMTVRAVHVAVYTLTFLPVVLARGWSREQAARFLGTIAVTHFVLDSRRWSSRFPILVDQVLHMIALIAAVRFAGEGSTED